METESGRVLVVQVAGVDSAAIELAALDEARVFFGPDIQLTVDLHYQARKTADGYSAMVVVREVV